MTISLAIKRADEHNFKDFGTLVRPSSTPDFTSTAFDWHENIAALGPDGAEVGMVCPRNTGDYRQHALEQHLHTRETLIPAQGGVLLVLARPDALDKAVADADDFGAFYIPAGTAAVLDKGVWHHAPMTLDAAAVVYVIYAAGTGARDKKLVQLADRGLEVVVNL